MAKKKAVAEIWLPVVGYESSYDVSNLGNVRSKLRYVSVSYGAKRSVPPQPITLSKHPCGYLVVKLSRNNKTNGHLVHRLVAAAFIGKIPDKCEINHKDGNKKNNHLANLEIVTRQENIDHAVRIGRINNKGSQNAQAKISEAKAKRIKTAYETGRGGYKSLGKRFGVSWGIVRAIATGRTWGHIASGLHEPGRSKAQRKKLAHPS